MSKLNSVRKSMTLFRRLAGVKTIFNLDALWNSAKEVDVLRLNVKTYGYELARIMMPALEAVEVPDAPEHHNLVSKPTTQEDVESPWFAYWCTQLKCPPIYHRKLWELAFTLQVLYEQGLIKKGIRGLGFGCGKEPLASYFASVGMDVTVTDLDPEQVTGKGWKETGQHTTAKDEAFYEHLVDEAMFNQHVELKYVDMNAIPDTLRNYDFCWSICALEHLGSIRHGLTFISDAMTTLRPGGVAVHTTEFNYLSNDATLDHTPTVLFRKSDFEDVAQSLRKQGHTVLGIDYRVGHRPLDRFVDVPPFDQHEPGGWLQSDAFKDAPPAHLKASVLGYPSTCMGLIVIKND